jgi:hypothetical protein
VASKRGFSLIELLVAGGLSLIATSILVVALVFYGSSLARQSRHSEAQRNVLLVLNCLRELMRSANVDSLHCQELSFQQANPPSVSGANLCLPWVSAASWARPDGSLSWTNGGETLWVQWVVVYYLQDKQEVKLQSIPINPPVAYLASGQQTLSSFTPAPSDRLIARNISSMTLTTRALPSAPNAIQAGSSTPLPPGFTIDVVSRVDDACSEIVTRMVPCSSPGVAESTPSSP